MRLNSTISNYNVKTLILNKYNILKSNEETISNGEENYLIEVKKKSGSNIQTIDPMEAPIIKEDNKSYYVYYIDHNENIELEVSVSESQIKKSGLRKYFIWVAVAVGITRELSKKYDAVKLVKIASEVLGGKGGGGRKDYAQAGGANKDKIEEAFKALSIKIN